MDKIFVALAKEKGRWHKGGCEGTREKSEQQSKTFGENVLKFLQNVGRKIFIQDSVCIITWNHKNYPIPFTSAVVQLWWQTVPNTTTTISSNSRGGSDVCWESSKLNTAPKNFCTIKLSTHTQTHTLSKEQVRTVKERLTIVINNNLSSICTHSFTHILDTLYLKMLAVCQLSFGKFVMHHFICCKYVCDLFISVGREKRA